VLEIKPKVLLTQSWNVAFPGSTNRYSNILPSNVPWTTVKDMFIAEGFTANDTVFVWVAIRDTADGAIEDSDKAADDEERLHVGVSKKTLR
jgi:hypothetical protein